VKVRKDYGETIGRGWKQDIKRLRPKEELRSKIERGWK
jgi:hypothetical protein